jgi:hypothetical protein
MEIVVNWNETIIVALKSTWMNGVKIKFHKNKQQNMTFLAGIPLKMYANVQVEEKEGDMHTV